MLSAKKSEIETSYSIDLQEKKMKFLPKKLESQKAQIYQRTRICNKHHLLINLIN